MEYGHKETDAPADLETLINGDVNSTTTLEQDEDICCQRCRERGAVDPSSFWFSAARLFVDCLFVLGVVYISLELWDLRRQQRAMKPRVAQLTAHLDRAGGQSRINLDDYGQGPVSGVAPGDREVQDTSLRFFPLIPGNRSRRSAGASGDGASCIQSAHMVPDLIRHRHGVFTSRTRVRVIHFTSSAPEADGFTISHNNIFDARSRSGRLMVLESGLYLLYAQVTFDGRTDSSRVAPTGERPPQCGYQTKLERQQIVGQSSHTITTTIMTMAQTQTNRGARVMRTAEGHAIYPMDSATQMGIFRLEAGDVIYTRPDATSAQCRIAFNPERTYFGGYRIE